MDDEDDYWNTSETKEKAFSFDDDVLSPQEILAIGKKEYSGQSDQNVFSSSISTVKSSQVPLNSLVSQKVLDLMVLAQSGETPSASPQRQSKAEAAPLVGGALQRLVLGRCSRLHTLRSLADKTRLLDAAVAVGDGNALRAVVVFLQQTLSKELVWRLVAARPDVLRSYAGWQRAEGKTNDLVDLLTMLGRSQEAAMYQFESIVRTAARTPGPAPARDDVGSLVRKLSGLVASHFTQSTADTHTAKLLSDYVKLLEWQLQCGKAALHNSSALISLAYCCRHHWGEGSGQMMSPLTVCQRQQIPPAQYEWVAVNVLAASARWDLLQALLTKKDWLGRSSVSAHTPCETLLRRLCELSAPHPLLGLALSSASEEDRLRLAMAYKMHEAVIDQLTSSRDRAALAAYRVTLPPHCPHYIRADAVLRDTSIKWKN